MKLSGPYESWEFVGSPFGWAQMAVMTQENKEAGFLQYSTATPPAGREIVVRFKASSHSHSYKPALIPSRRRPPRKSSLEPEMGARKLPHVLERGRDLRDERRQLARPA